MIYLIIFVITSLILMKMDYKKYEIDYYLVLLNVLMLSFLYLDIFIFIVLIGCLIIYRIPTYKGFNTVDIFYFTLVVLQLCYNKNLLFNIPVFLLITIYFMVLRNNKKIPYLTIILPINIYFATIFFFT